MPTYPLGFYLNPLTNPWVEKLTQTHILIEQKPIGFRVAGTHCYLYVCILRYKGKDGTQHARLKRKKKNTRKATSKKKGREAEREVYMGSVSVEKP
jgi:hypothetical protein